MTLSFPLQSATAMNTVVLATLTWLCTVPLAMLVEACVKIASTTPWATSASNANPSSTSIQREISVTLTSATVRVLFLLFLYFTVSAFYSSVWSSCSTKCMSARLFEALTLFVVGNSAGGGLLVGNTWSLNCSQSPQYENLICQQYTGVWGFTLPFVEWLGAMPGSQTTHVAWSANICLTFAVFNYAVCNYSFLLVILQTI